MAKILKSEKREKARQKRQHGMKVSKGRLEHIGNSIDKRRAQNGK